MRACFASRSKMPPEVQHALFDFDELALQVA